MKQVANPEDSTGRCKAIYKAIRKGELDEAKTWTCPGCGMEWRKRPVGTVSLWEARPIIEVW